jgi:uncharacterized protein YbaP (TraB family)
MPKLFKLTKQKKTIHLYATCHFNNDQIFNLSAETKQAFEQASRVVLEITLEEQEKIATYLASELENWKKNNNIDSDLTDYLSISLTKKIAKVFEEQLSYSPPSHMALFELLETSPMHLCYKINIQCMHNLGLLGHTNLDKLFYEQARLVRKPVIGLDSAEDLAKRLIGCAFSYQEQVDYAKYFFAEQFDSDSYAKINELCRQIQTFYLEGDIKGLQSLRHDKAFPKFKLYLQSMVEERDQIFVHNLEPHLDEADTFIAIGAMHIPGVLALLEACGWKVEPIQESECSYPVRTLENTNITLSKTNLLADFKRSMQQEESWGFFSQNKEGFTLINSGNNLQIFLELIIEKKIDSNHKLNIKSGLNPFNESALTLLKKIVTERNTSKTIELDLRNNREVFTELCQFKRLM